MSRVATTPIITMSSIPVVPGTSHAISMPSPKLLPHANSNRATGHHRRVVQCKTLYTHDNDCDAAMAGCALTPSDNIATTGKTTIMTMPTAMIVFVQQRRMSLAENYS
ncbi:hypothetical protein EDB89DRAFT_1902822 [Lactarius sanguifluus]|nr:hypothetical protein EDB89DRAFT_1902822 [Lactarius sanguifluus]